MCLDLEDIGVGDFHSSKNIKALLEEKPLTNKLMEEQAKKANSTDKSVITSLRGRQAIEPKKTLMQNLLVASLIISTKRGGNTLIWTKGEAIGHGQD